HSFAFLQTTPEKVKFLAKISPHRSPGPDRWKSANVTPIHKSRTKANVYDYRFISLLPLFSLVFENIVINRLFYFTSPYLLSNQHAFLPHRSSLTSFAIFQNHTVNSIVNKSQLDTVFFNFSEAFVSVDYTLLLCKLEHQSGINVDKTKSDGSDISSGFSQGSVLSSYFFTLYVDNLYSLYHKIQIRSLLFLK
ncbi:hypothetical protein J437_LFUL013509, partial [Ladona fulva]